MRPSNKSKQPVLRNPFSSRNWETDIRKVLVEPCDVEEDPLGYKAIFYLSKESARAERNKSFVIGASFLTQRDHSLRKAGYKAPMTQRAIELITKKIGRDLPLPDFEALGRAV